MFVVTSLRMTTCSILRPFGSTSLGYPLSWHSIFVWSHESHCAMPATFRFLHYGQVFDALDLSGQVAALTAVSIQETFQKTGAGVCAM
jgi:hypothetical protein